MIFRSAAFGGALMTHLAGHASGLSPLDEVQRIIPDCASPTTKREKSRLLEEFAKIALGGGRQKPRPLRWCDSVCVERVVEALTTTERDDPCRGGPWGSRCSCPWLRVSGWPIIGPPLKTSRRPTRRPSLPRRPITRPTARTKNQTDAKGLSPKQGVVWPGMTRAGTVVLPNGWSLKPAGRQIAAGRSAGPDRRASRASRSWRSSTPATASTRS